MRSSRLLIITIGGIVGIGVALTVLAVAPDPSRWDRMDAVVDDFQVKISQLSPSDRDRTVLALRKSLSDIARNHPAMTPAIAAVLSRIDRPDSVSDDTATTVEHAFEEVLSQSGSGSTNAETGSSATGSSAPLLDSGALADIGVCRMPNATNISVK